MRVRLTILWISCSISLLAAISSLAFSSYNKHLQNNIKVEDKELNELRSDINKGLTSKQYAQSIIQDLATLSLTKPEVRNMLSKIGVTVTTKPGGNP